MLGGAEGDMVGEVRPGGGRLDVCESVLSFLFIGAVSLSCLQGIYGWKIM